MNILFSGFGVRLWNEILHPIRDLHKKEFKGEIRQLLLNILVNENDYIVTPIIVYKICLATYLQLVNVVFINVSTFLGVFLVISLPPLNSICSVSDCNNCNNFNFILKQF